MMKTSNSESHDARINGRVVRREDKVNSSFRAWTAVFMLVSGVALSAAGFFTPPVGQISESVLWFFAQCLLYAGSALGIDVIIDHKIKNGSQK